MVCILLSHHYILLNFTHWTLNKCSRSLMICVTRCKFSIQKNLYFIFFTARYTLSTSNSAIAALLCALYPHFPAHSTDNRWDARTHTHGPCAERHCCVLMLLLVLQLPPAGSTAPGCVGRWAPPPGPGGRGLPEALLRPARGHLQGGRGHMCPVHAHAFCSVVAKLVDVLWVRKVMGCRNTGDAVNVVPCSTVPESTHRLLSHHHFHWLTAGRTTSPHSHFKRYQGEAAVHYV